MTTPDDDPTRIRSQPALTRSTGRVWLIVGGIFTVMALAVLVPMTTLPPSGVALAAAIVVVLAYATIVLARLLVPARRLRLRLGLMAVSLLVSAAVALIAAVIVATAAAQELTGVL